MEEKTYSQMRLEFQKLFYRELSHFLSQYEKEREQKRETTRKVSIIAAILAVVLAVVIGNLLFSAIVSFAIAGAINYNIKKKFENTIKSNIMPRVCRCFGNIRWQHGICSFENILPKTNLIEQFNKTFFDDNFVGIHKDVNYEISEGTYYHIQEALHNYEYKDGHWHYHKGSINSKKSKNVFSGVIVKLDMNKKFKGNTVIYPDTHGHKSPSSLLKHTVLEDVTFEQKFDVFTDDEVEARYLITPSFMERLNNMKTAFFANRISCAFYEQYLFIALDTTKDLFSIGTLNEPVNDPKQFFTMYEEIVSIIKLIDHFKLDQKLGL